MLVLSVPAPTSRANLTGLVNRTRLIRRSPLVPVHAEPGQGGFAFNVSLVSSSLGFLFLRFASPFAGDAIIVSIQLSPISRFTPVYGCGTCGSGFSTVLVIDAGLRRCFPGRSFLSRHPLSGGNCRRLLNWSLRCHASRPWFRGSWSRSICLPRSYRRTGSW